LIERSENAAARDREPVVRIVEHKRVPVMHGFDQRHFGLR
jgi:hypothetical protein